MRTLARCCNVGRTLWGAGLVLLAVACSTLAPMSHPDAGCSAWYQAVDSAIDAAGVRDAEADRIAGFAGLRITREVQARGADEPFDTWLDRLIALEREGRAIELANLPAAAWPIEPVGTARTGPRQAAAGPNEAGQRLAACSAAWRPRLRGDTLAQGRLHEAARVPDRYSTAQRALGLYPLLRWPFLAGVEAWHHEHQRTVARWFAEPPSTQRHEPVGSAAGVDFERHAPAIEIEASGREYDRFGALRWADGPSPVVDVTVPVVYTRRAATRWGGHWHPQLVYTLWFPERPSGRTVDPLAGHLDGLVLRLTLSLDGRRVLMLDTIHPCGCYHLFMPAPGVEVRDAPSAFEEWAFVTQTLPALADGERLVVRITSAEHQVVTVAGEPRALGGSGGGAGAMAYTLRDERALRTLPLPTRAAAADGHVPATRSIYGPDGLVPGTERSERRYFWPMGIASAGAMRQWGHHATAFIGRRHFDDADLLEARFVRPAAH